MYVALCTLITIISEPRSVVVSVKRCNAGDPGSIPGRVETSDSVSVSLLERILTPRLGDSGADPGGGPGGPPLTTKNEAPAPKFYKTEAPEWQF